MSKKLSYNYVFEYFKKHNCEMLDKHYVNDNTKIKYICKCGNESSITFRNFVNGRRCINCYGKTIYDYNMVVEYYLKHGCELLETEYKNNRTSMKYKCKCGNISSTTFHRFMKAKRCIQCYYNVSKGENHPKWNSDRSRRFRTAYLEFDKKNIDILSNDLLYNDYLNDRENYQIDHIFPRIAFIDNNLDKKYDPVIIKEICNSRDNLQILTSYENNSKSGKYDNDEFMKWFNKKLDEK